MYIVLYGCNFSHITNIVKHKLSVSIHNFFKIIFLQVSRQQTLHLIQMFMTTTLRILSYYEFLHHYFLLRCLLRIKWRLWSRYWCWYWLMSRSPFTGMCRCWWCIWLLIVFIIWRRWVSRISIKNNIVNMLF